MYFNTCDCGDRIRRLRLSRSMTQFQLASKLNSASTTLCNIEKGTRSPSIELLIDIAELFHVSLDYLILGKDEQATIQQLKDETEAALDHIQQIQRLLNR